MSKVQIIAIALNLILLGVILELIRRGRLKEKYSLLWLFSIGVMLLLSFWRSFLDIIAEWFGIFYAPSLLFLVAFLFLILISLHFTVAISGFAEKNKRLAQEIGLLKHELEKVNTNRR